MKITKQLRTDLQDIEENFPGLYCRINHKNDIIVIDGYLDICDTKGNFWDSFDVRILYKFNSLYNVPIVIETSNKIPREDSRHISEEGVCCVDLPHKLKFQALKGIKINDFIKEKVYPYFANQLFYDEKGYYLNGEWSHNFEGIIEFYKNELDIKIPSEAILCIESILAKKIPNRNDPCVCGKDKYKRCHLKAIEFLKDLGVEQLKEDLEGFKKYIENN